MKHFAIGLILAFGAGSASFCATAQTAEKASAVLFDGASFGGAPQPLMSATPNLSSVGFDDRASAIDVRSGTWQVCSGRNFEGDCRIIGPGRHRLASFGLDNNVSSLRPAPAGLADNAVVPVTLHSKKTFRGDAFDVFESTANLSATGFDSQARSIIVRSGTWEICSEPNYGGRCHYVSASEANLGRLDLSRDVSSLRQMENLKPPADYDIVLFPEKNHRGAYRGLNADHSSLAALEFDDRTRSVQINRGEWLACERPVYLGRCEILNADLRDLSDMDFAYNISSLRRLEIETIPDATEASELPDPSFAGEKTVFYPQPSIADQRLDQCLEPGLCGPSAAGTFCRAEGYSGVAYFAVVSGIAATADLSGQPLCTSGDCTALSDVLCLK